MVPVERYLEEALELAAEIAARARERGVPVHTDAAQSMGKIPVRVDDLGVDLLSLAGHKLYGPKGVGALYVRDGVYLEKLIHGAGHEDGRRAGTPLSEGISPVQGADRQGPTAVLKSAGKIDHLRTGGTLLNQKFTPDFFRDERSIRKVTQLIRSYFRMDGHHIQFNVVSADTLRDAQKHPEKYQDLIVRVAGYSDYFNDLGPELQDEIIRRTEHESD